MLAPSPANRTMVNEGQKHKIIQEFLIPDELKDDIAYCQRSLRDCVKVHQDYAERCKSLATNQQTQVKQYLLELEAEMLAIGREQSGLVQDLTRRLKLFQQRTANERRVELGDDLANGYVAWLLSNHCEIQCNFSSTPHKVTERLSESQLYQKYRLDPIIKQEPGEDPAPHPSEAAKPSEKKLRKRPVLQTSLLKPQPECPVVVDGEELKHSLSPPVTPPTPPPLPPPLGVTKATVAPGTPVGSSKRKTIEAPVELKNLRSRSVNGGVAPKAKPMLQPAETVERASSEEQIPPTDTVLVTAAMKRSRNILHQALNKAKITQKVSPPSSATKSNRGSRGGTAAIEQNQQRGVSVSSDSSNSRSSTPGSSQSLNGSKSIRPVELATVSSDDSSNERFLPLEECCPPPPENIHEWDQYTFLKLYGLYTLEDSKLLKERKNERKRRSCCSTERKEFHYGRYDHFEQQYYVLQSKRRPNGNKRPALLYTSTSAEKCGKKRSGSSWPAVPSTTASPPPPPPPPQPLPPISTTVSLASDLPPSAIDEPTSAGEDKKLSLSDSLAAAAVAAAGKSGLAILEPENKLCFVCNQIGSTDSLSACIDCCNIYHLSCHSGDDEELPGKTELASNEDEQNGSTEEDGNVSPVQILPQRDNLCPVCLAAAHRPKPASTPVL